MVQTLLGQILRFPLKQFKKPAFKEFCDLEIDIKINELM